MNPYTEEEGVAKEREGGKGLIGLIQFLSLISKQKNQNLISPEFSAQCVVNMHKFLFKTLEGGRGKSGGRGKRGTSNDSVATA